MNFELVTKNKEWKTAAEILLNESAISKELSEKFHLSWIVSGHHMRQQINDDGTLIQLLRHVLPPYSDKGLTLYRGENSQRWESNQIGLCWTPSIDVAQMFGRGLNSHPVGGMLLKCNCKEDWIIAGPSSHSLYLGEKEYTVDPSVLKNIEVLSYYESAY